MTHLSRFAAPAIAFSAVSFSLTMNALYGWSYQPYAFGGYAVAVSALIFDSAKAVVFPALKESIRRKQAALATVQTLILTGFIALSLFATLSFFSQIIEGKQKPLNDEKAHLTSYIAATKSRIKTILDHKYSNNCMIIDGSYTRRWCEKVNSKTGAIQNDSVPAMSEHLERLTARLHKLDDKVLFWGALPVKRLTGLDTATTTLSIQVLMAVLMEILSGFGFILLSAKVESSKPDQEMQTPDMSRKQLMQAMYDNKVSESKIAQAFNVQTSTVKRNIVMN